MDQARAFECVHHTDNSNLHMYNHDSTALIHGGVVPRNEISRLILS